MQEGDGAARGKSTRELSGGKFFTTESPDLEQKFTLSGHLVKRGGRWPHRWQERFFLLETTKLEYYAEEAEYKVGQSPRGVIPLNGEVRVSEAPAGSKPDYAFVVTTQDREYLMVASSQEEMVKWVEALSVAIRTSHGEVLCAETLNEIRTDAVRRMTLSLIEREEHKPYETVFRIPIAVGGTPIGEVREKRLLQTLLFHNIPRSIPLKTLVTRITRGGQLGHVRRSKRVFLTRGGTYWAVCEFASREGAKRVFCAGDVEEEEEEEKEEKGEEEKEKEKEEEDDEEEEEEESELAGSRDQVPTGEDMRDNGHQGEHLQMLLNDGQQIADPTVESGSAPPPMDHLRASEWQDEERSTFQRMQSTPNVVFAARSSNERQEQGERCRIPSPVYPLCSYDDWGLMAKDPPSPSDTKASFESDLYVCDGNGQVYRVEECKTTSDVEEKIGCKMKRLWFNGGPLPENTPLAEHVRPGSLVFLVPFRPANTERFMLTVHRASTAEVFSVPVSRGDSMGKVSIRIKNGFGIFSITQQFVIGGCLLDHDQRWPLKGESEVYLMNWEEGEEERTRSYSVEARRRSYGHMIGASRRSHNGGSEGPRLNAIAEGTGRGTSGNEVPEQTDMCT